VAEKSVANKVDESAETAPAVEDTLPIEVSKKKLKVSPVDSVNEEMLDDDMNKRTVADWPTRNSLGLAPKPTGPVWA